MQLDLNQPNDQVDPQEDIVNPPMPVQNGDLIEFSDIVQQGEEEVYLPLLPQNQAEIDLMQQLMNYMSKSSHPRVVVSFIKSTWNS
jgi:hypothetical protein